MQIQIQHAIKASPTEAPARRFEIAANGKSFYMMLSGIYTDKPRAVLRELVQNGYDAHTEAGVTRPVEVRLPNTIRPILSVRDFGRSMSPEFMLGRYCSLTDSTKDDSNDLVGGLGIGRMAPLSMSESYSVTTFISGTRTDYLVYLDEDRVPHIVQASIAASDEPNGTLVEVPFTPDQVSQLNYVVQPALGDFPQGSIQVAGYTLRHTTYSVRKDNYGLREGALTRDTRVVMGPIAYKLDWQVLRGLNLTQHFPALEKVKGLDIFVQLGEVDIAPSRETLDYSRRSAAKLAQVLRRVSETLVREARDYVFRTSPYPLEQATRAGEVEQDHNLKIEVPHAKKRYPDARGFSDRWELHLHAEIRRALQSNYGRRTQVLFGAPTMGMGSQLRWASVFPSRLGVYVQFTRLRFVWIDEERKGLAKWYDLFTREYPNEYIVFVRGENFTEWDRLALTHVTGPDCWARLSDIEEVVEPTATAQTQRARELPPIHFHNVGEETKRERAFDDFAAGITDWSEVCWGTSRFGTPEDQPPPGVTHGFAVERLLQYTTIRYVVWVPVSNKYAQRQLESHGAIRFKTACRRALKAAQADETLLSALRTAKQCNRPPASYKALDRNPLYQLREFRGNTGICNAYRAFLDTHPDHWLISRLEQAYHRYSAYSYCPYADTWLSIFEAQPDFDPEVLKPDRELRELFVAHRVLKRRYPLLYTLFVAINNSYGRSTLSPSALAGYIEAIDQSINGANHVLSPADHQQADPAPQRQPVYRRRLTPALGRDRLRRQGRQLRLGR